MRGEFDQAFALIDQANAVLASTEAHLGMAVLAQGRPDEADRLARRVARLATEDDLSPQSIWRRVRAVVLAGRGRLGDAERLADEAVALAASTDYLNEHAGALEDLGRIHALAGRRRDAQRARAEALELYLRKGNVVSAVQLAGPRLATPLSGSGPVTRRRER
jgi:tetratricopeptide (TPR) repeat protein